MALPALHGHSEGEAEEGDAVGEGELRVVLQRVPGEGRRRTGVVIWINVSSVATK